MSSKKYGRTWKRIRDRYIKQHPNCEICLTKMKCTPATEVHHIVPISRGGQHLDCNLLALCHKCHTEIHRRENRNEIR